MEYYIKEIKSGRGLEKTAGVKARDDCDLIFDSLGIKPLCIPSLEVARNSSSGLKRLFFHFKLTGEWNKHLVCLKKGDTVYIQFPLIEHFLFQYSVIKALNRRGVVVILIIHDLEILRNSRRKDLTLFKRMRMSIEERTSIRFAGVLVSHNCHMESCLRDIGVKEPRIVNLGIFDYLTDEEEDHETGTDEGIIIAGNLSRYKAGYVYNLPSGCRFNLYGIGYDDSLNSSNANIFYYGAFNPKELIGAMAGKYGLVWDGESSNTCSGVSGEYLKINNPHKTSLYLAAGIPVIVWNKAAIADIIRENNCGLCVGSLDDLDIVIARITDAEYMEMKKNAEKLGAKLRSGYFMKNAVTRVREGAK